MSSFDSLMDTFQVATGVKKPKRKAARPSPAANSAAPGSEAGKPTGLIPTIEDTSAPYDVGAMHAESSRVLNLFQIRSSLQSKPRKPVPASAPAKYTLAICACVVDAFPNEPIWRRWSSECAEVVAPSGDTYQAKFHIHAAQPNSAKVSPWVKQRLLQHTYAP